MNTIAPKYNTLNQSSFVLPFCALPSGYTKVDNYLIRGPHPSVRQLLSLKKEGVNQIYDFRHLSNFGCKFIERFMCRLNGIKYIRLPYSNLYGEYPDLSVFEKVAASVKQNGENGGRTLFHCNSGRHRTSHFSAFYALTKGKSLEIAQNNYKDTYEPTVNKIIQEQVIDKKYFSRIKKEYTGINPIMRLITEYNNKIVDGIFNAHQKFVDMLSTKKHFV